MEAIEDSLNVLHLISSVGKGGAEKLLVSLIEYNAAQKRDVAFFVAVMNDFVDEDMVTQLEKAGCRVFLLNKKEGNKHPKYLLQLLKSIRQHRISIIHSHDAGSKYWSMLCKLASRRLKLIYTVHDTMSMGKLSRIELYMHNMLIDHTIAISGSVLNDCIRNGIRRVIKIYNGIHIDQFLKDSTQLYSRGQDDGREQRDGEKKYDHAMEPLRIINVARINHHIKGQDILIKALKRCRDRGLKFVCTLVGGVHEYDKPSFAYLRELVRELDLEEEIEFSGGRNDVPELLARHDLFVLPSRHEGLGLVLLEAMAAGLPVIASDQDGPKELVVHGETGLLFETGNDADLCEKILYGCLHRNEMKTMAQKAYEYVQRFDISSMYRSYCELYEKTGASAGNRFNLFNMKLLKKRFALFESMMASIPGPVKILDVGGTQDFWNMVGFESKKDMEIWLLNITSEKTRDRRFHSVAGDARDLRQFREGEFDIVFSNSVIEHVGGFQDQQRMAGEIYRVGKRYFVQTPNRYFPVEPHFLFPLFQFFPIWLKAWLLTHCNIGWYKKMSDWSQAIETACSIRLLSSKEMLRLFPGSGIYRERFMGLVKSIIVYGGWEEPTHEHINGRP